MDYADIYEELGQLIADDSAHEKVANLVMRRLTEAFNDGKLCGELAAAEELQKVWQPTADSVVDISQLDRDIYADIRESITENPNRAVPVSPRENLDVYLQWNGIIGYTDHIIRSVHSIERAVYTPKRAVA